MSGSVGIIANPSSGRDIRRLVAYGAGTDNHSKVNIVCRIIVSLASMGVKKVWYMPEYYGIVQRAINSIYSEHLPLVEAMDIRPADIPVEQAEIDSTTSAAFMAEQGVSCIITMGGDGTNRAVAKGSGAVPLIPVSTGTNNVFPKMIEGTIAGLAAGAYADERLEKKKGMVSRQKQIDIYINDVLAEIALIDAVVVGEGHIGSRAVWDAGQINAVMVTRCNAHSIGISAIPGQLQEVNETDPFGLLVELGKDGEALRVPLGPGLIQDVRVQKVHQMHFGEEWKLEGKRCVLALDGERSIVIKETDHVRMLLNGQGPVVMDTDFVLRQMSAQKLLHL